jgi:hypothetical protein
LIASPSSLLVPAAPSDPGRRLIRGRLARAERAAAVTRRIRCAASPVAVALAAGVAVASVLCGGAGAARAQVVYQLAPSLGAGVTDNAQVSTAAGAPRQRGGFGTISAAASADYERALSTHALSYLFAYTRFFNRSGPDTLTNTLTWSSSFRMTPRLSLALTAGAVLSRISRVDLNDLTTVTPQASTGGNTEFLTANASETLSYQPTPLRAYTETIRVSQLNYINAPGSPTNDFIAFQARASWVQGRNTFFIDTQASDSFVVGAAANASRLASGHSFIAQITAGWERELTPTFTSQIQAGPMSAFRLSSPAYAIIAPGGTASLNYQSRPWFASVSVSQAAAPNLFLGEATINRGVLARLALPLNRNETVFVTGFGGYIYARLASDQGSLGRLFDQWTTGASLSARFARLPIAASLQYTLIDQNGGTAGTVNVPGLERQTLTINVGGIFAWGPGTAPLFRGTL